MARRVTIVMYHVVGDIRDGPYPRLHGVETSNFIGQLQYVRKHYQPIRMEDLLDAVDDPDRELPDRALLLTFDDGYAGHHSTVVPILERFGLQGSFFPPARAVLERRMLDVHKIHYVLASADDATRLASALDDRVEAARGGYDLEPPAAYRARYATANRWDPPEVVYVKRMLQVGLPAALRAALADELFHEFVSEDGTTFADRLYMSTADLRDLRERGMFLGSHSYDHVWLDALDPDEQEAQVVRSRAFLQDLGCDPNRWVVCYPYGGFDDSLLRIVARHGGRIGLATRVDVANLDRDPPLALPRLDTNDLPLREDAAEDEWTRRVHEDAAASRRLDQGDVQAGQ